MTSVFTLGTKAVDFLKDVALIKAAAALIEQWPAMPDVNDGRSLVAFLDVSGANGAALSLARYSPFSRQQG
ncbi:MAG: hypothetical protein ABI240_16485 [Sphingomonas sp.]